MMVGGDYDDDDGVGGDVDGGDDGEVVLKSVVGLMVKNMMLMML